MSLWLVFLVALIAICIFVVVCLPLGIVYALIEAIVRATPNLIRKPWSHL